MQPRRLPSEKSKFQTYCINDYATRNIGAAVTRDEYENHLARIKIFRDWFDRDIMNITQDQQADAVMILPYGVAEPKYRDVKPEYVEPGICINTPFCADCAGEKSPPTTFEGINSKLLSPVLETPHIIIPCMYYLRSGVNKWGS
jgi:hypothetical protein